MKNTPPPLLIVLMMLFASVTVMAIDLAWPTETQTYFEGVPIEEIVQPTSATKPYTSACFGCVRDRGRKFHEGVDIRPTHWDTRGEAADQVVAALPGTIVHVNEVAGRSSYGQYVVVEHSEMVPAIYTLYAHLSSINPQAQPGVRVQAGSPLGIMGRSATHQIAKKRSHLHFEMGLMLTNHFQTWYDGQEFGSPNRHGKWNGMNLVGFDPLDFFGTITAEKRANTKEYLKNLPVVFKVRVADGSIPNFVQRYPDLLEKPMNPDSVAGWDIEFTWFGLPVKWTPLNRRDVGALRMIPGDVEILSYDEGVMRAKAARKMIKFDKENGARLGKNLKQTLKLLFTT